MGSLVKMNSGSCEGDSSGLVLLLEQAQKPCSEHKMAKVIIFLLYNMIIPLWESLDWVGYEGHSLPIGPSPRAPNILRHYWVLSIGKCVKQWLGKGDNRRLEGV